MTLTSDIHRTYIPLVTWRASLLTSSTLDVGNIYHVNTRAYSTFLLVPEYLFILVNLSLLVLTFFLTFDLHICWFGYYVMQIIVTTIEDSVIVCRLRLDPA